MSKRTSEFVERFADSIRSHPVTVGEKAEVLVLLLEYATVLRERAYTAEQEAAMSEYTSSGVAAAATWLVGTSDAEATIRDMLRACAADLREREAATRGEHCVSLARGGRPLSLTIGRGNEDRTERRPAGGRW